MWEPIGDWRGIGPARAPLPVQADQVSDDNDRAHAHESRQADREQNPDKFNLLGVEVEEWKPDGLLLTSSTTPEAISVVAQFAVEKRLPTIIDFDWTLFLTPPHPLPSYGPVYREMVRSAAISGDKILHGASPANLPIERPSRFELIVNQKTARAIGLDMPAVLVAQAAKVTEWRRCGAEVRKWPSATILAARAISEVGARPEAAGSRPDRRE